MEPRKETQQSKETRRTLDLKREVLRDLDDPLLSSQGWTLWCCDDAPLRAQRSPNGAPPE
ncbi:MULTISPECIES: hypothetical protein [unclassified Streptomyces]|jgi:hypothetical protein|uniref:hypothetical protein n=1 Tax=unclassified Streptomyces TaxID=2593676 RepID=UPI002E2656B0